MSALLIILYVAFDMCYRGVQEMWRRRQRLAEMSTFKSALIGIGESAPIRDNSQ